eukprot:CAMPEP_0206478054 /NCGR_PEP_ID=MMETSP0324_2-20121206/35806_1 /ASSEMBLY_ACC=CAM_ASM_000836 /TAXON_ID=2866 /ORGANISM="Crypthecodinium cohnii, Strain Seligo" /LENGTH=117 /DNA_ID=CAMNT_0053954249 /DNA_START=477 /DNA_END=826 /DNA_ORIENTATION=+
MDVVIEKLSFIGRSVSPLEVAMSSFLAELVVAFISGAIWPDFDTLAVLLVLSPLTLVLRAISMVVGALSVSLIVLPLSFVDVAIDMLEPAVACGFVELPLTVVLRSIRPDLHPLAVT